MTNKTEQPANTFLVIIKNQDGDIAAIREQVLDQQYKPTEVERSEHEEELKAHGTKYAQSLGWQGVCQITIVGPLTAEASAKMYDKIPGKTDDPRKFMGPAENDPVAPFMGWADRNPMVS